MPTILYFDIPLTKKRLSLHFSPLNTNLGIYDDNYQDLKRRHSSCARARVSRERKSLEIEQEADDICTHAQSRRVVSS